MCPILVVTGVTEMEDFTMNNKPSIKIGIVAVSRDCFPESLSVNRRKALVRLTRTNIMQMKYMNVQYV